MAIAFVSFNLQLPPSVFHWTYEIPHALPNMDESSANEIRVLVDYITDILNSHDVKLDLA